MIYTNENGNVVEAQCEECERILKFRKNMLKYNSQTHTYTLPEPVECFCGNVDDIITNVPEQSMKTSTSEKTVPQPSAQAPVNTAQQPVRNIPRCPTCGSEHVQKISLTSKAVGGYFFGLFSSNVRNTYKCLNCGYKW